MIEELRIAPPDASDETTSAPAATGLVASVRRIVAASRAHPADRDDLVQETLLRVWPRVAAEDEGGRAGGLLRTTLERLRIDAWRRRRRAEASMPSTPASTTAPHDELAHRERRTALRAAIARLPDAQRDVVRMRVEQGMKFREIATALDAPLNTVLGRMRDAVMALREMMDEDTDAHR